jgi:hypothetical protein
MASVNSGWLRAAAVCLLIHPMTSSATQPTVPIVVRLTLQDQEGKPIGAAPIRLVTTDMPDWQQPGAGAQLITDALGEARWSFPGRPAIRQRKLPTNFFTQITSRAQETTHFAIGAQLPYVGRTWLVVTAADRFPDGTVAQLDGLRVYGLDANGAYTVPATFKDGAWRLPGIAWPLTTPGAEVSRFTIAPLNGGWEIAVTIRRMAEPVVR